MAKIALDVVLLPSQEMMDMAIEANRKLLSQRADRIVLDGENRLAHISLAMGCADQKDLSNITKILQAIAEDYSPGPLTVTGILINADSSGEEISVLQIKKTQKLQSLHEAVMRQLSRYFSYDVTAAMLIASSASQSTLDWIRNYPEKSSYDKFSPHITLGYGRIDEFPFPIEFTAARLALCHLGNFCTCRKVLAAAELRR